MRTGLWMAAIILAVVLVGGVLCSQAVSRTAEAYISTGQELEVLCLAGDWQQAEAVLAAALQAWRGKLPWLCTLVNHADGEVLTAALTEVGAAIRVRDVSRAVSGCRVLMAAAAAMQEHEQLIVSNIL